jgi:hypothetical protein
MIRTLTSTCIECGKKLLDSEHETGFCAACDAKVENDLRILRESDDGNFAFLADLTV